MVRDRRVMMGLAAAAVAVRAALLFAYRIDSDEPQHLHVAWAWSRGLVQYRDVFDNHFPLLHLLFAPLMRVVPESSMVFTIARLAILPVALACGWLLYRAARPLVGERSAAIAAITFSVMPPWLPKSVEFRNDTLWIFCWLAALVLLMRPKPAPFWAGVAAALCLLASVKALPILLAHGLALLSQRQPVSRNAALCFLCGAAIPLVAVALFFAWYGAFGDMLYATLFFNASLPVLPARRIGGAIAFAALAPLLAVRGRGLARVDEPRALHLILFAAWYSLVLLCFWPSLSPRDFLPLVPLAAIAIVTTRAARAPIALFAAMTLASVWYAQLWRPADRSRQQFVDAAVRLTAPGDYVFDLKGNAIFRRRPIYVIYDIVGRALTGSGRITDAASEQIVARHCCVAIEDMSHIPARTRAFLNSHFVDIGPLRVCGSVARHGTFTIAVPETYAVVANHPERVTIDGMPYRGPRFFAAGRHTLAAAEPVTVIWWRAWKGRV
jgi:hypothetical protein